MSKAGIYVITNTKNGNQYIGSSINVNGRLSDHKRRLRRNDHPNPRFQNAWNKHGEDNFEFSTLEVVEDLNTLLQREQYYLDTIQPVYNLAPNAGGTFGYKHSEATVEKLRQRTIPLETRERISQKLQGRKLSEETRAKMRAERNTPEGRERMKKVWAAQKPLSVESRKKLSESQKIAQNRPEVIEKQRKAQTGRIISQETRLKRSQSLRGRKRTDEQTERNRAAQLRPEVQAIKREKQRDYWRRRKAQKTEGGEM